MHASRLTRVLMLFLTLATACRRGESRGSPSGHALTIFVASSLVPAFQDLADTMRARDSSLVIRLNGGGSSSLVSQLELGGTADLLVTADEQWMKTAQDKGLARTADAFAGSSLAVVMSTRSGSAGFIKSPINLASPGAKIVLAAPQVPLGRYSRLLLRRLARLPGYGEDFATRVELGVVSQELSAAGVASKLRLGEADAGILYRAQLLQDTSGALRELAVPFAHEVKTQYFIARTTTPGDSSNTQTFLALLRSEKGAAVLRRHGFELPASSEPSAP